MMPDTELITFKVPKYIKDASDRSDLKRKDIYIRGLNTLDNEDFLFEKEASDAKLELYSNYFEEIENMLKELKEEIEKIDEERYSRIEFAKNCDDASEIFDELLEADQNEIER